MDGRLPPPYLAALEIKIGSGYWGIREQKTHLSPMEDISNATLFPRQGWEKVAPAGQFEAELGLKPNGTGFQHSALSVQLSQVGPALAQV